MTIDATTIINDCTALLENIRKQLNSSTSLDKLFPEISYILEEIERSMYTLASTTEVVKHTPTLTAAIYNFKKVYTPVARRLDKLINRNTSEPLWRSQSQQLKATLKKAQRSIGPVIIGLSPQHTSYTSSPAATPTSAPTVTGTHSNTSPTPTTVAYRPAGQKVVPPFMIHFAKAPVIAISDDARLAATSYAALLHNGTPQDDALRRVSSLRINDGEAGAWRKGLDNKSALKLLESAAKEQGIPLTPPLGSIPAHHPPTKATVSIR